MKRNVHSKIRFSQNFNPRPVLFEAKPLKFDFQADSSKTDEDIVANKVIPYKSQYLG